MCTRVRGVKVTRRVTKLHPRQEKGISNSHLESCPSRGRKKPRAFLSCYLCIAIFGGRSVRAASTLRTSCSTPCFILFNPVASREEPKGGRWVDPTASCGIRANMSSYPGFGASGSRNIDMSRLVELAERSRRCASN